MASVGLGHYVVVVLHVGGSKASDIKLVLQREPRTGKTWFLAGSILPIEELVDVDIRELLEETGLALTLGDLTMLSDAPFPSHYMEIDVSMFTSSHHMFRFPT
jgi:8-oxo-dGTP pyrophosphatase MutT (NUDIX family)